MREKGQKREGKKKRREEEGRGHGIRKLPSTLHPSQRFRETIQSLDDIDDVMFRSVGDLESPPRLDPRDLFFSPHPPSAQLSPSPFAQRREEGFTHTGQRSIDASVVPPQGKEQQCDADEDEQVHRQRRRECVGRGSTGTANVGIVVFGRIQSVGGQSDRPWVLCSIPLHSMRRGVRVFARTLREQVPTGQRSFGIHRIEALSLRPSKTPKTKCVDGLRISWTRNPKLIPRHGHHRRYVSSDSPSANGCDAWGEG